MYYELSYSAIPKSPMFVSLVNKTQIPYNQVFLVSINVTSVKFNYITMQTELKSLPMLQ